MKLRRKQKQYRSNVGVYGFVLFAVVCLLHFRRIDISKFQTGGLIVELSQQQDAPIQEDRTDKASDTLQQQQANTDRYNSNRASHGEHKKRTINLESIVQDLKEKGEQYQAIQDLQDELEEADPLYAKAPLPYTPEPGNVPEGVLSSKPKSFFKDIRYRIDEEHPYDRCKKYSFLKKGTNASSVKPAKRRIFFGALIADEPWELLEIVAAETFEIFEAMVFVESNRTQHFVARPLQRQGQEQKFQELFGIEKVQIRNFVNENSRILDLAREHEQRQEILLGWKELGMTEHDIGYLADMDETFTRDFLRAMQECPNVDFLDYDNHHCHPDMARINGAARVFEASPDCIAAGRTWYHPDAIIGACIELIGNSTKNPIAPRQFQFERAFGFADTCKGDEAYTNITDGMFPLYNAADFRRMCGGQMVRNKGRGHTEYTAYHFHNFFASFNQTRWKYKTYGHPQYSAFTLKLENLHMDLELVSRCAHNMSNDEPTKATIEHPRLHHREEGGLEGTEPFWPVYFFDRDYRERKHRLLYDRLLADEVTRKAYKKSRVEIELARRKKRLKNSKILSV